MTVHQFPARYQSAPPSLARLAAQAERDTVAAAQVDVLNAMARHPLDLAGDVQVLAALLGYLARSHGIEPDVLAYGAVSSVAVDGPRQ